MTDGSADRRSELAARIARLPERPGCYLFKNEAGDTIYVGKALSLKHRVASYFQESRPFHSRTDALVRAVADLDFITTDTELEALVLENTLVKENQPRYNVVLRDDKNFPYLRLWLSNDFPRLSIVRRPRKGRDAYYGPYIPASEARRTIRMVHQEFQLRSCSEDLDGQRDRPCLYYQIGQCLAPCVEEICSQDRYAEAVNEARMFLDGRGAELARRLKDKMKAAAAELRYEEAARYRDMVQSLEQTRKTQKASSTALDEQDVFGFFREGGKMIIHVLIKRSGLLRRREEILFKGGEGLSDGEVLGAMVQQFYERFRDVPREILLPVDIEGGALLSEWLETLRGGRVNLHVPQRGEKRRFVTLAADNARLAHLAQEAMDPMVALEELKLVLSLPTLPRRIEGFDNSNIQGSDPVSSMVSFVEGLPCKDEYRRFSIRSVQGADDFATMREVVGRRYRRVVREGLARPDLILIDGGIGQVSAALSVLEELELTIPLVGLAKREEQLVLPGREETVNLPRDNPALKLLQRVRDEAHRFAIGYHRKRRRKNRLGSELASVPGLGPVRQRRLLREFGSLEGVRSASLEELKGVVGPNLAREVRDRLGRTD